MSIRSPWTLRGSSSNLPNVYWTFITPMATIIGMYTNVPEHGSIHSTQQQWLTNEFATAADDRALILALHHPIYSFDVYHSGSSKMADALENAIRDTGRCTEPGDVRPRA